MHNKLNKLQIPIFIFFSFTNVPNPFEVENDTMQWLERTMTCPPYNKILG